MVSQSKDEKYFGVKIIEDSITAVLDYYYQTLSQQEFDDLKSRRVPLEADQLKKIRESSNPFQRVANRLGDNEAVF